MATSSPTDKSITSLFPDASPMQMTYIHGRTSKLPLASTAARLIRELIIDGMEIARLKHTWQKVLDRHGALQGAVKTWTDIETDESGLIELRKSLPQRRISLEEFIPVEVISVALREGGQRLLLIYDLLVTDAESYRIIESDWACLYAGKKCSLMAEAKIKRQSIPKEVRPVDQAYWNSRLSDFPRGPVLPYTKRLDEPSTSRLSRISKNISLELMQSLRFAAHRQNVPFDTLLLAIFFESLGRWCQTSAFSIALVDSMRDDLNHSNHGAVGNFTRLLILSYDLAKGTFTDRVNDLANEMRLARHHDSITGHDVLHRLSTTAESGHLASTFVGASINLENEASTRTFGSLSYSSIQTPFVALDHSIFEESNSTSANFDFSLDHLKAETIEAIATCFINLLTRLTRDETIWSRSTITELPTNEIAIFLEANQTDAPIKETLLHQGIWENFDKHRDLPAIITSDRVITYYELAGLVTACARAILDSGAMQGDIIAVHMKKGWAQVVAVLACLEAGCAYLPTSPDQPEERLRQIFDISGVRLALSDGSISPGLYSINVCNIEPVPPQRLNCLRGADELAYVIFTSGSSGVPKGVMIDHRGARNTVDDINERFAVSSKDRVLALSNLFFDLSVYDIFGLLAVGGALVIPTGDETISPSSWVNLVNRFEVTIWNSVPSLLQLTVNYASDHNKEFGPKLRLALLSGDWIPTNLPSIVFKHLKDVSLISLGGATEASIWSIIYPISKDSNISPSIPYGKPLRNQKFRVVDSNLNDRPIGVPGELLIGGVGLARGYMGDKERTNRAFITCPETGDRFYKTGDLGRYLPCGNIEFLGRLDDQVKINGYRVELADIEVNACRHESVKTAVATVFGEKFEAKRLILFVVPKTGLLPDFIELKNYLIHTLPPYMVPSQILLIESVPLSPNGKVNRNALKALLPREKCAINTASYSKMEKMLDPLWRSAIKCNSYNLNSSFFDLGGDSIAALEMLSKAETLINIDLSFALLLQNPSLRGFASAIESLANQVQKSDDSTSLNTSDNRLVLMRRGTNPESTPFFLVHPIGGAVTCYQPLIEKIDASCDIWAIQHQGHANSQLSAMPLTLPLMASQYGALIEKRLQGRPLRIGGWSFGGAVAFEIARNFELNGQLLEQVILIDSPLPKFMTLTSLDEINNFASDFGVKIDEVIEDNSENILKKLSYKIAENIGISKKSSEIIVNIFDSNTQALREYQPLPLNNCAIDLIWASFENHSPKVEKAWEAVAKVRNNIKFPETHKSIIQNDATLCSIGEIISGRNIL
jgi:pyochelin synthetase